MSAFDQRGQTVHGHQVNVGTRKTRRQQAEARAEFDQWWRDNLDQLRGLSAMEAAWRAWWYQEPLSD